MKKIILFTIAFITSMMGFTQTNFKSEKIDSISKTKSQIYSDTKMFIAEFWKSAINVIQNDDMEAGMILLKGSTKQSVSYALTPLEFWYSYNVKFLMKDNKYKIIVDEIKYQSGPSSLWDKKAQYLVPLDEFPGYSTSGLPEKQWNKLISNLKTEILSIVDNYEKYIKKQSSSNDF